MTITAYNNHSDSTEVYKNLTDATQITNCILKDETEIVNPTLIFAGASKLPDTFNYFYIPAFNRYYFITNKTTENQRIYISLHVDVLESRRQVLLNNTAILERSSNKFNLYQTDGDMPQLANNEIFTKNFPNSFQAESLILTVAGGTPSTPTS